jgi:osmotically-inducible protein OsmY
MAYDKRQPAPRTLFILSTSVLAVGLASIDSAFERVDRYIGQATNPNRVDKAFINAGQNMGRTAGEARKTVERANNGAGKTFATADLAVDNTALAARVNAALNAGSDLESSTIEAGVADGMVSLAGAAENATKRDLTDSFSSPDGAGAPLRESAPNLSLRDK